MEMSHENEKREIRKNETIIIPGIDRGVIPMGVFPEDLSGVMTKYYEKLLPKEGKRFGKLSGYVVFLIAFFGLTTLIGLLYAMMRYGLQLVDWRSFCGNACYGNSLEWWEEVNRFWAGICSLGN